MMFNKPDEKRVKLLGPDRTCAEWVLRNGGSVVWIDGKKLSDYNYLPSEDVPAKKIREIDGSNSSISHYGFSHLIGCTDLKKIILHNNKYINDSALKGLEYARESLTHLQVSQCINVTDVGIRDIKSLRNLEMLVLFELEYVENLEACKEFLQNELPKCKIEGKSASFVE
ncbi:ATP synthase subunit s, mitochondrial [Eumeta japonica]|uniref:ATP synthase subunit s, mitochondrial n=1 Tax=Eumeta variegata TaxID=151549 RepID=A0A4C1Z9K6_EUMVA|nr:ATP synthase subunit s, mitochondrial [Eumeta japonica]